MPVQYFPVAAHGGYIIRAAGAAGGGPRASGSTVCSGGYISAVTQFSPGDVLAVFVGGQGANATSVNNAAGGGGGSYVYLQSYSTTVPIVTAGGPLCVH